MINCKYLKTKVNKIVNFINSEAKAFSSFHIKRNDANFESLKQINQIRVKFGLQLNLYYRLIFVEWFYDRIQFECTCFLWYY